jgi:hypothetical protein
MAIVAEFETAPPAVTISGTAPPTGADIGTVAFTWYRPMNPGARPENKTGASIPPMVAVTGLSVIDSGDAGAAAPAAGGFVTAPRPVQKI